MKNGLRIAAVLMIVLGAGVAANAGITVNVDAGFLYADAAASEMLPGNSVAALIVDADGDGWDAYTDSLVEGSFLADEDDQILDIFATNAATYGAGTHAGEHNATGVTNGAQFALFWFDMVYTEDVKVSGPAADTAYGFYTSSDLMVPAEGALVGKQLFTENTTAGTIPDGAMAATYTVVPEPFTMGVLAVGGLAMLRRRRAA